MAKDEAVNVKKKKFQKIRTLFKWIRRLTLVAGIVGAVRKYQMERNGSQPPPRT